MKPFFVKLQLFNKMGGSQSSPLSDIASSLGGPSTDDWNTLFKDISQVCIVYICRRGFVFFCRRVVLVERFSNDKCTHDNVHTTTTRPRQKKKNSNNYLFIYHTHTAFHFERYVGGEKCGENESIDDESEQFFEYRAKTF